MPKSKTLKKKKAKLAATLQTSTKENLYKSTYTELPGTTHSTTTFHDIVDPADLQITIDTLDLLAQRPSLIKSKLCKDLRTAVYAFRQASTTGLNSQTTTLTARVSAALADAKYVEARVLLAEMRIRKDTPKLGALCRWVRDLDVTSGLSGPKVTADMSDEVDTAHKRELWLVLDAILRTTGGVPQPFDTEKDVVQRPGSTPSMAVRTTWDTKDPAKTSQLLHQSIRNGTVRMGDLIPSEKFKIIEIIPGALRKPPNLHPATLYTSQDNTIPLSADPAPVTHLRHPTVPNLSLLRNVLSPFECASIVFAAESIGFSPDAPIREAGAESSVLAHNFYWITDMAFTATLWDRVKGCIPREVEARKVRGLNRRFRVYRYVPGAEYRCHIDGAWPPSSIEAATGTYIYDASPLAARQSSLFTFLIYLNDEFAGGETTFFLPAREQGLIDAYPVRPVQGSVVMFPHGDAEGSLLHEGTGVRADAGGAPCAKYVIRTDVLYDVDAGGVD